MNADALFYELYTQCDLPYSNALIVMRQLSKPHAEYASVDEAMEDIVTKMSTFDNNQLKVALGNNIELDNAITDPKARIRALLYPPGIDDEDNWTPPPVDNAKREHDELVLALAGVFIGAMIGIVIGLLI